MRRKLLPWAGMLLVSVSGLALAQTDRLPPDAVLIEADTPQTVSDDMKLVALEAKLASGAIDDIIASLAKMRDPLEYERSAARLLDRLQAGNADAPAALLDALEKSPVRVYRRHEETAADWFLPVYDIPAKVQSLRRLQQQRQAVTALRERLQDSDDDAAFAALAAADPQVAALAVESATDEAVRRFANPAKRSATAALPSPALAALARRTRDPVDFLHALAHAAPLDVLPLFESTLPKLAPAAALPVLRDALARPDYASAAAFALVTVASHDSASQDLLRSALDAATTGPSIAAALARAPDGLDRIDGLLVSAAEPAALKHLALALRLQGTPAALQRLDRLQDDPRLPATVRTELQR